MNKYDILKTKLAERQPIFMGNMMVNTSPVMLAAFEKADCILIDKEHGVYGNEELIPLTLQCRAIGLPSIIRVEEVQYHLIAKALDLGADGIMVPRTETVEQVKTAVESMRFFPEGKTGIGGWGIFHPGETIAQFNKNRFLFLQIESEKGLSAMEDMIAAYGDQIDAFIIGPNDFSILSGVPLDHAHPKMLAFYEKFYAICKKQGYSCGIFDPDEEHTARDVAYGANIFWLSDDLACLKTGFEYYVSMTERLLEKKRNT